MDLLGYDDAAEGEDEEVDASLQAALGAVDAASSSTTCFISTVK